MRPGTSLLSRTAGWLALGYFLLVAGFMLWNVLPERDGAEFLLGLLVIPWLAAPVVAAAACAGASPNRQGAITFLMFEMALILLSIWATADMLVYGNSTAGIGILLLPILEWGAFNLVFLVALACGWRMRPDFLREEPAYPLRDRLEPHQ
jgi:hypothetical protein